MTCSRVLFAFCVLVSAQAEAVDLTQVPRTIAREPGYQSPPKYCLLVFGPEAATRVWLVHDGDALYADLNGDGDLTESGERIVANDRSEPGDGIFGFDVGDVRDGDLLHKSLTFGTLKLDHLATSEPQIAAALAKDPATRFYFIGAEVEMPGRKGAGIGGRVPQAVTAGDPRGVLRFCDTPELAPVIHFGGDWEITLYGHLELVAGRQEEVYLGVGTPGLGDGTMAFVGYEQLVPNGLFPKLTVAFPGDRAAVQAQEYTLTRRCCTYNFHGPVAIPDDVTPGEATVTVSFDDWIGGFVAPTTHRVQLVAPKVQLTLEPVSPRLKTSLIHPTRDGVLVGIRFSPDGQRIIAGDYPGGVIQVWDVDTQQPLRTIETGFGYRSSEECFSLAPDWGALYVSRSVRKVTRIEREGKALRHWELDGDLRAWDPTTGAPIQRFQHSPPRNFTHSALSPDGRYAVTGSELSGDYEAQPDRRVSIWDLESGTVRDVSESPYPFGVFSSDSQRVAISELVDRFCREISIFDTSNGDKVLTIPLPEFAIATPFGYSPDGSTLIGRLQVFPEGNYRNPQRYSLSFWDVATGKEVASIPADPGEVFSWPAAFSPDGNTMGLTNLWTDGAKLFLVDLARREITMTVPLTDKSAATRAPAFSPDGRWAAVATQEMSLESASGAVRGAITAEDLPQPRIHLVEVATGQVRETMVAPQGFASSLAFSPDGKTLATGGKGCVLLWDLSIPPGELAAE
ncbi:MAG: PD40 domain-containing protein [Planctomycetaceae bacterium]|nr:PD40 domain-containing protein [Planctomycetaceae bacterium]